MNVFIILFIVFFVLFLVTFFTKVEQVSSAGFLFQRHGAILIDLNEFMDYYKSLSPVKRTQVFTSSVPIVEKIKVWELYYSVELKKLIKHLIK